jgi:hypothetical protein
MPDAASPPSVTRAVLLAAIVSLLVTALRLYGEQQNWAPTVFAKEPGGSSWFGITLLVLPFGFWFGRRLAHNGHRPASTGKALLLPVAGIAAIGGLGYLLMQTTESWTVRAYGFNTLAVLAGLATFVAWRRAWFVLAFYGVLARLPVVLVQYESIQRGWDNHFAKGPPGSDPNDALFLLTLAQCAMWPFGWTVLVGGFCAAIGAATVRKR